METIFFFCPLQSVAQVLNILPSWVHFAQTVGEGRDGGPGRRADEYGAEAAAALNNWA